VSGTALVAGGVVQRSGAGGHAWVFAQYVKGLQALGWRVVFVDRAVDAAWDPQQCSAVLELLGGPDGVAVLDATGASVYGLSRPALLAAARQADLLLNVMGYLDDQELLEAVGRRVFLDIDPGFGQMWRELGLADVFAGHDAFLTVASRIEGSGVPTCGLPWRSTLPPVFLPDWPVTPPAPGAPITSVATWRGPFAPIELEGTTYGLRVHELRRFLDLPARTGAALELALDIDPSDDADRLALLSAGWALVDPAQAAGTPAAYRRYVSGSWFSDRSSCYLATGRPVVVQDTGVGDALPTGDGVLLFGDADGAVAAIADLADRYDEHCEAARAVAESHLSTDVVLPRLLDAVLA
jgi:hypothetical protein